MKTLLLLFIKVVIAAIIIGAVMYIEQFFSGFGVMAIYIMAFISFILPDSINDIFEEWNLYFLAVALCLFMIPWIHIDIGLRVIHKDNRVEVVTAFYPLGKTLGGGYEVDTLKNVACCYWQDGDGFSVKHEDMFMLKGETYNTLFSKRAFVAHGTDYKFEKRNLGHGRLHICSYTDTLGVRREIDMDGKDIKDSKYSPRVIDATPDYSSPTF